MVNESMMNRMSELPETPDPSPTRKTSAAEADGQLESRSDSRLKPAAPLLEPWMRQTHTSLDALRRAVVHALEQAREDTVRWALPLTPEQLFARPQQLPSVAFHLRHIARSLDRLLTYAEDRALNEQQLAALSSEHDPGPADVVLEEAQQGIASAIERVLRFSSEQYEQPRGIGRKRLPTTVGGLLIHCAEHTQRHIGQMVTTAKLVQAP